MALHDPALRALYDLKVCLSGSLTPFDGQSTGTDICSMRLGFNAGSQDQTRCRRTRPGCQWNLGTVGPFLPKQSLMVSHSPEQVLAICQASV